MKTKIFKSRNAFGQPIYEEFSDLDGLIAIGLRIAYEQPDNPKAQAFVAWLKSLGRKPTDKDFEVWLNASGWKLNPRRLSEFEDFEN